jgi:hypothetical protein
MCVDGHRRRRWQVNEEHAALARIVATRVQACDQHSTLHVVTKEQVSPEILREWVTAVARLRVKQLRQLDANNDSSSDDDSDELVVDPILLWLGQVWQRRPLGRRSSRALPRLAASWSWLRELLPACRMRISISGCEKDQR